MHQQISGTFPFFQKHFSFFLLLSLVCLVASSRRLLQATARDLYRPQSLLVPQILIKVPITYHLTPMLCLSGDAGLWGSVMDAVPFVVLRHAYCVEGPRRSAAIDLYAQQIIEYLVRLHDFRHVWVRCEALIAPPDESEYADHDTSSPTHINIPSWVEN